jgi:hypothetical protein
MNPYGVNGCDHPSAPNLRRRNPHSASGPGVQRGVWPSLARREHLLLSSHQQPAATWLEQFVSMFFGVKSGTSRTTPNKVVPAAPVVSSVGLHHFITRGLFQGKTCGPPLGTFHTSSTNLTRTLRWSGGSEKNFSRSKKN